MKRYEALAEEIAESIRSGTLKLGDRLPSVRQAGITNGALEALNLCLQAVTRPGDSVIIESPTFYAALQALERTGVKAIEVPTHPREGIDLAALALERHQPKACWLMTNFQNPLGSLMPDAKKRALVALLAAHAKACDANGLVMHCSSFSKCLAPGYRIGWVAARRFTQQIARLQLTTTLSASGPAQAAIADYLAKGGYDKHLRQLRHALSVQQSAMIEAVARHFPKGSKATMPEGGYFLWVELPGNVDALGVHRLALSLGISVAPGPMFSARQEFANCLRQNYGHPWNARAEAAFVTLGQAIAANTGPLTIDEKT